MIDERRLVILDTWAIRELVAFRAIHEFGFSSLHRTLRHITVPDGYDRFSKFVSSFAKRVTSSIVSVELYNWIRKTEASGQPMLWNLVLEEFTNSTMIEETVKLDEMDKRLLPVYGPVDASLIGIARRYRSEHPIIVTGDSALLGVCGKCEIRATHIGEVTLTFR